jgi:hypothetical protein
MERDKYLIVRVDYVTVPAIVAYIGHCDTPYDMNLRYTSFRDSATHYSNKRDAIRQAKQSSKAFPGCVFKVKQVFGRNTVWSNRSV